MQIYRDTGRERKGSERGCASGDVGPHLHPEGLQALYPPALRPKKEPRISNRGVDGLLDRGLQYVKQGPGVCTSFYLSVFEPLMYGRFPLNLFFSY